MHTEMWEHPATQDNVATLRRRGATVVEPAVGRLTGADSGQGRLPEPARTVRAGGESPFLWNGPWLRVAGRWLQQRARPYPVWSAAPC